MSKFISARAVSGRSNRSRQSSSRRSPRHLTEMLEPRVLLSAVPGADDVQNEAPLMAAGATVAPPAAPAGASSGGVSIAAASPDSDDTDPTAWEVWSNVDAAFLNGRITAGFRISDIEVDSASPLRFTATMVQNTGSYAKAWWWYVGVDVATISQALTNNNARLTDIESYNDNGVTRYAAVMISNTGADAKSWWWYVNATPTQVGDQLTAHNARLTDFDRHNGGNSSTFDAIMVNNTGADGRAWWYYYNQTPAQINSFINANNARLVDVEAVDSGHFDVVMERSSVSAWWWYYGLTAQGAVDTAIQNGARIFDIERYDTGSGTRFAAIMVNNSNEVTTRVGQILRDSNATADTGLYLKQVGGPELAGLRAGDRFEPASMIKGLLNLTAMRAVQAGTASLTDPLFMYYDPANPYVNFNNPGNPDENPDSYADTAANRVSLPMQQILERMMERSDNRATKSIDQRFGRPAINATADLAGMTNTDFASTLGSGVPGNYLTLVDAGKMYEGVLNHTLLNAANAGTFFKVMTDSDDSDREQVPFGEGVFGPFQTVVTEEAAALLNKPTTDSQVLTLAGRFIAAMTGAWKGGGYTISNGTDWREVRTAGGYVGLPFWGDDGINVVDYVYGVFIDNATVPKSNPTPGEDKINQAWSDSQGELLRVEIRKALASWRPTVQNVYVSNSAWTPAFRSFLDAHNLGDPTYGYSVPDGAGQLTTVPWLVNRVSIRFNQAMSVQSSDLTLGGVSIANYPVSGFTYDGAAHVATWTFSPPPATQDRLLLNLNADGATGAASALGLKLDGEWANGADAFPSGNGAQGGDFNFRVNVLTGDADRSGRVNAIDLGFVKARLNFASTDVPNPRAASYSAYADIDGNGRINAIDLGFVKARLNNALPIALATQSLFGQSPVADASLPLLAQSRRGTWLDAPDSVLA